MAKVYWSPVTTMQISKRWVNKVGKKNEIENLYGAVQ